MISVHKQIRIMIQLYEKKKNIKVFSYTMVDKPFKCSTENSAFPEKKFQWIATNFMLIAIDLEY